MGERRRYVGALERRAVVELDLGHNHVVGGVCLRIDLALVVAYRLGTLRRSASSRGNPSSSASRSASDRVRRIPGRENFLAIASTRLRTDSSSLIATSFVRFNVFGIAILLGQQVTLADLIRQ